MIPSNLQKTTSKIKTDTLTHPVWPKVTIDSHDSACVRAKVAEYYRQRDGVEISMERIVLARSRKQLFFNIWMALQSSEVYLASPSSNIYLAQLQLLRRKYRTVHTRYFDQWKLGPNSLGKIKVGGGTGAGKPKLLVLNVANYPAGSCYSQAEIDVVVAHLRKLDAYLLQDEGDAFTSMGSALPTYSDRTIVTSTIPSVEVAYAIFPPALSEAVAVLQSLAKITSEIVDGSQLLLAYRWFSEKSQREQLQTKWSGMVALMGRHIVAQLQPLGIRVDLHQDTWSCILDFCIYQRSSQDELNTASVERVITECGDWVSRGQDWGQLDDSNTLVFQYADTYREDEDKGVLPSEFRARVAQLVEKLG